MEHAAGSLSPSLSKPLQEGNDATSPVNKPSGGPRTLHSLTGVPVLRHGSFVHMMGSSGRVSSAQQQQDQAFRMAVGFVQDALDSRSPNTTLAATVGLATGRAAPRECGLTSWISAYLPRKMMKTVVQFVVILHCLLTNWESVPPSTSTAPFVWWTGVVEVACLAFYTVDQIITVRQWGWRLYSDKLWEAVFFAVTVFCWIDWIVYYPAAVRTVYRFARPLRPLLGISKRKSLRRLMTSLMRTVPRLFDVTLLLCVVIFFLGSLGQQLFNEQQVPGYANDDDNFNTFLAAALAMFTLQTTENYPSVANLAYFHRPVMGAFFFIFAMFIFFWVVGPLLLAIVYDHYKTTHRTLTRTKRVKQYVSLVFAYQTLMGGDANKEMDKSTFTRLARAVRPLTSEEADVMFEVLDVDGSGAITIAEFLRLPVVMRLQLGASSSQAHVSDPGAARNSGGCVRAAVAAVSSRYFMWCSLLLIIATCTVGNLWTAPLQEAYDDSCLCSPWAPPAPGPGGGDDDDPPPLQQQAAGTAAGLRILSDLTAYAQWAVMGGGGGGARAAQQQQQPLRDGGCEPDPAACALNPVRWSSYACLALLLAQACELAVRALAHNPSHSRSSSAAGDISGRGWGRRVWAFSSWWNAVDAAVVVLSLAGHIGLLGGIRQAAPLEVADLFEAARALPFLRLIGGLPRVRTIVQTASGVFSLLLEFTLVYCAFSYGYVVVGMAIFGAGAEPAIDAFEQEGQSWTFDTFPRAWLAIIQITMGNNWNSVMMPNMDSIGTRWGAWYFVSFRYVITDIYVNLIEGVFLDAYGRSVEERNKQAEARSLAGQARESAAEASGPADWGASGGGGGGKVPAPTAPAAAAVAAGVKISGAVVVANPLASMAAASDAAAPGPALPGVVDAATAAGGGGGVAPAESSRRNTSRVVLSLRMRRELFDEISAENAELLLAPRVPVGLLQQGIGGSRVPLPTHAEEEGADAAGATPRMLAHRAAAAVAPAAAAVDDHDELSMAPWLSAAAYRAPAELAAAHYARGGAGPEGFAAPVAAPRLRPSGKIFGVSEQEIAMLETALRAQEAAMLRRLGPQQQPAARADVVVPVAASRQVVPSASASAVGGGGAPSARRMLPLETESSPSAQ